MKTDTPETDRFMRDFFTHGSTWLEFARKLERQRNLWRVASNIQTVLAAIALLAALLGFCGCSTRETHDERRPATVHHTNPEQSTTNT